MPKDRKEYLKEYREKNREVLLSKNKKYRGEYYTEKYKDKRIARTNEYRRKWYELIKQKGKDRCSKCGYNKCFDALDYHHINPEEKKYNIGHLICTTPSEEKMKELDKCICLCSNCHRELHSSMRKNRGKECQDE